MISVKFYFLLVISIVLYIKTHAHLKSPIISIEEAFRKNKIILEIKGKGEHKGNSASIVSKNISNEAIILHLEYGRRLMCSDSSMQDLLIVKEQLITLTPNETKTNDAFAFCCESTDRSPQKDINFSVGKMAPPEWIKLAEVINKNNFPIDAIQHAIWVLSNNHEIASVHSDKMDDVYELRKTLAEIKGIELPWYNIYYLKDTSSLFSGKHYLLKGDINYIKKNNGITSIQVRDKNGRIMNALVKNSSEGPGNYSYHVNLNIKGWPKGEYQILIFEDSSQLIFKKTFTL
ncbi:MAG: hypothetical protein ACK4IK_03935 [Bacteroidia bacterium]